MVLTKAEWKEKYPHLVEETMDILDAHKPLLDYLKQRIRKVSKQEKALFDRSSIQNRITKAVELRNITFDNLVRVLDGKPLSDVSKQRRKAFLIQESYKSVGDYEPLEIGEGHEPTKEELEHDREIVELMKEVWNNE